MGHAGIGQHALDTVLLDGQNVADCHRQGGKQGYDRANGQVAHREPLGGRELEVVPEGNPQHPQSQSESGRLGGHRQIGGDGGRRTLVYIRCPEMEGRHGDLVAEAYQDHQQGSHQDQVARTSDRGQRPLDIKEVGGTCQSEQQAQAVEHDAGRKSAVNNVF